MSTKFLVREGMLVVLLTFFLAEFTTTHPAGYERPWSVYQIYTPDKPPTPIICDNSEAVKELCQRCAKKSKSEIVYPMCCDGKDEAREWCERYINHGLQERHFITEGGTSAMY